MVRDGTGEDADVAKFYANEVEPVIALGGGEKSATSAWRTRYAALKVWTGDYLWFGR